MVLTPTTLYRSKIAQAEAYTGPILTKVGLKHELKLARGLRKLAGITCYHDFSGVTVNGAFQVDLFILAAQGYGLVCEVKAYRGLVDKGNSNRTWTQFDDWESRQVSNPIPQVLRTSSLVREFLVSNGIFMPIVPAIVMTCQWSPSESLRLYIESEKANVHVLTPAIFYESIKKAGKGIGPANKEWLTAMTLALDEVGYTPILTDFAWSA